MIAIKLSLNQCAIRKLRISDAYSIHRVVYSLFDRASSENDRILYSDLGGDFYNHSVLVVSNRLPNLQNLPEGIIANTREIPDHFFQMGYYRFKTKINVSKKDSKTKRIIPIRTREHAIDWFLGKSNDSWGFSPIVDNLEIEKTELLNFQGKNRHIISIHQITFSGILKVSDLTKFKNAFSCGLGRGKAFGCGLLEIYPLNKFNN